MERQHVSTGTDWESEVGYSRAVRTGTTVHVAGTTAVEDGEVVGEGDPYRQTTYALGIVADALAEVDAGIEDVVRTRLYVTDIGDKDEVGRAHGEVFGDVRPAATLVQVERLVEPELLVEVEAVAEIANAPRG